MSMAAQRSVSSPGATSRAVVGAVPFRPALNALIKQALRANPDLKAAQAALRVAQGECLAPRRGLIIPEHRRHFSPAGRRTLRPVAGPDAKLRPLIYNLYTAQLSVSYTPDVFGGQPRAGRIAGGAGRGAALPARSDLSHADRQCGGRGRAGGVPARPDRGDPEIIAWKPSSS